MVETLFFFLLFSVFYRPPLKIPNLQYVPFRREWMELESEVDCISSALHFSLLICYNHVLQQQVMNTAIISHGNKGCDGR